MEKDYPGLARALDKGMRDLGKHAPEVMSAFRSLAAAIGKEGSLDTRAKELLALGISIATRCEGCIALHARAAFRAGATRGEVVEAVGVAVELGGGPAIAGFSIALIFLSAPISASFAADIAAEIRIEKPLALAAYLLGEDRPERIEALLEGGRTRVVRLPRPIPVHLT